MIRNPLAASLLSVVLGGAVSAPLSPLPATEYERCVYAGVMRLVRDADGTTSAGIAQEAVDGCEAQLTAHVDATVKLRHEAAMRSIAHQAREDALDKAEDFAERELRARKK